jgi:hypothetical protein
MVRKRKVVASEPVDTMEKLARLAAIYITKDMDAEDAAVRLLGAGFDSPTIGGLLNKNPNFANNAKFKAKG